MSTFALNIVFVQEGEFYAHSAAFGFSARIPKNFLNTSFEAEEAAKELTAKELAIQAATKTKATEKAKEVAKKSAAAKQAKVTSTMQKTHQKPAKDKEMEQTASAPAKEDAPVITPVTAAQHPTEAVTACSLDVPSHQAMHCSMSFRAFVLVGVVALVTAFYQSTQRPVALTVTTGLTSRASVLNRARSSLFGPHFRAFHLL